MASSSTSSRASTSAERVGGTASACTAGCATACPPCSVAGDGAARPGRTGFCSGGLRENDCCRAVVRPGSEGQRLGAARKRRQRPCCVGCPRCGGARAHRRGPRRSSRRVVTKGAEDRRGRPSSPGCRPLRSVTPSFWCWTTLTLSRPRAAARLSSSSPNRCHPSLSWCWSGVAIRECGSAASVQVAIWSRSGPRSLHWTPRRREPLPHSVVWSCPSRRPRLCASGRRGGLPRSRWQPCRCETATMPR